MPEFSIGDEVECVGSMGAFRFFIRNINGCYLSPYSTGWHAVNSNRCTLVRPAQEQPEQIQLPIDFKQIATDALVVVSYWMDHGASSREKLVEQLAGFLESRFAQPEQPPRQPLPMGIGQPEPGETAQVGEQWPIDATPRQPREPIKVAGDLVRRDGDGLCNEAAKLVLLQHAELERLKAQLPDSMKDCKIVFRQCTKGHGWLTATNWEQHGCPTCLIESLRWERDAARNDAVEWELENKTLEADVAGLRSQLNDAQRQG